MPISSLIVIALRLYAIFWLVQGLTEAIALIPFSILVHGALAKDAPDLGPTVSFAQYILIPALAIGTAVVLWLLAEFLSVRVIRDRDATLSIGALTLKDLYQFAFVFLGLYFFLSSIQSCVLNAHKFFVYDFPLPDNDSQKGRYLPPLAGNVVSIAAGLGCIFGAAKWSRKLIGRENSSSIQK